MKKNTVIELSGRETFSDSLTELLRNGARKLIQYAIEAELIIFIEQFSCRTLGNGKATVICNGFQAERQIQTGIGPVRVKNTESSISGWRSCYVQIIVGTAIVKGSFNG